MATERTISQDEAVELLLATIKRNDKSVKLNHGDFPSVLFDTPGAWAVEASVYLHHTWAVRQRVNNETTKIEITYSVGLSWSSTTRSTSQAALALRNYGAALALAQELEAVIQNMPTIIKEMAA